MEISQNCVTFPEYLNFKNIRNNSSQLRNSYWLFDSVKKRSNFKMPPQAILSSVVATKNAASLYKGGRAFMNLHLIFSNILARNLKQNWFIIELRRVDYSTYSKVWFFFLVTLCLLHFWEISFSVFESLGVLHWGTL